MPLKPGQAWGQPFEPATSGPSLPVAASDAELAEHSRSHDRVRLVGGDVYKAIGSPPPGRPNPYEFPIDVLRVVTDRGEHRAAAHVVVRRRGWRGQVLAIMNSEWLGEWLVAPRAHPGDGRADVVEVAATMPWRQRWRARRLVPLGAHVPHPDITTRSVRRLERTFDRPVIASVDGRSLGPIRTLAITVEPDAVRVVA